MTSGAGRDSQHIGDLLPAYINRTLDATTTAEAAVHLASCAACRAKLASWQVIAGATRAHVPAVTPDGALMNRVWTAIDASSIPTSTPLSAVAVHAWRVLVGQLAVVQRSLWLASVVAMGLWFVIAASGEVGTQGLVLQLVAPIVAAVGMSMVYGPEVDPSLELALATPTSPRLVLLARLTLVFGYDFALTLAATAGLAAGGHAGIWNLSLDWLGPMLFLSALALVLSLRFGPPVAMSTALILWIVRVFVAAGDGQGLLTAQDTGLLAQAWSTNFVTLAGAAILVAVALASMQRQERFV